MNESLPVLIQDFAYILIVAGITTVIFKILKQPLVLGYIVAGFLAGSHFSFTPSVIDTNMCEDWGQIGVIFIMFTLGLEFSFKKIVNMGISPILCVCLIMGSMMLIGNTVGHIFQWSSMDCLFLGGMLSMSSTTIIYKAYDEMGLRHRKFAGNVLSVLILEDIMGILLMILLSTISVSREFHGMELIKSLVKLGSLLIIWFIVGVFLLPSLLKKYKRYINNETLMIVSLALCFVLVFISSSVGYSPAFGAFMMGSILSETIEAEQIMHAVNPVKDLFGAIFFVSVGMMVNPDIIVENWLEILILTVSIIIGQSVFGTFSYMVTGSSLKDSIHSGFSMTQIGEFAFIIAVMGESFGVISSKIYPIVVAVSIITTFCTPYMIKFASPACNFIDSHIKFDIDNRLNIIDNVTHHNIHSKQINLWKRLLTAMLYQSVAYFILSVATLSILYMAVPLLSELFTYIIPYDNIGENVASIIGKIIGILAVAPFLRAICIRKNHSIEARYLRKSGWINKSLLWLTFIVRFILCTSLIFTVLNLNPLFSIWMEILFAIGILSLILYSRLIKMISIRMERIFKQNLYRKENIQKGPVYARKLRGKDLHITRLQIPEFSLWSGNKLAKLNIGRNNGVHVAAIIRGRLRINIPGGDNKIFSGDILELVGDDKSIELVRQRMNAETTSLENYPKAEELKLHKFVISNDSKLVGVSLGNSRIREQFHCTVIGFEDNEGNLISTTPVRNIKANDTMWVVGEYENLELLKLITNPPFTIKDGILDIK